MRLNERPLLRRRWLILLVVIGLGLLAAAMLLVNQRLGFLNQPQTSGTAEVLYLSPSEQPELWLTGLEEGSLPRQLTNTGGSLYDFAASPDGAWIAFSARNQQDGYDLWEIDSRGRSEMLLPCGTDWCVQPAYDPENRRLAYSRRQISGLPGAEPGAPRVWIFDREARQTDTLFIDINVGGSAPRWSPDGRFLAFLDAQNSVLQIADMQADGDFSIPAAEDTQFSWSPDSRGLLLTRTLTAHEHPYTMLVWVDVISRQEQAWLDDEELDTSVPVWSVEGDKLAAARRVIHDSPGKQIWILGPDGSALQQVTNDPRANHAAYSWSPDGSKILFQRFALGSSSSRPEVLVWNQSDGALRLLAEDAFQPAWRP